MQKPRPSRFVRAVRLALFALLPVALIMGGFAFWLLRQNGDMLLAHATPLVSTRDWQPKDPRLPAFEPFEWVSDHELLFAKRSAAGSFTPFLLDLTTRREQALRDPFPRPASRWPTFPTPSPDGKFLLWSQQTRNDTAYILTDRSGKIVRSWQKAPNGGTQWLPDGHRFATRAWVNGREHLYLHTIDSPAIETRALAPGKYFYIAGSHFTADGHVFGMAEKIAAGMGTGQRFLVEHDANGALLRESPLVTPGGDRFALPIYFSPETNRIVWETSGYPLSPMLRRIWKVLPFLPIRQNYVREFWISRLDGTSLHLAGRQTAANVRNSIGAASVLPDGKRLGFLYQDQLYTVPLN